jgi:tRNA nucleotidyltransferase (CCA-adding enzyme)
MADNTSGSISLTLTPLEQQLRDLLVSAAEYIDQQDLGAKDSPPADGVPSDGNDGNGASASPPRRDPLVLRWAGGWVRDKLLGLESHDIDTAINVMTGEAFVKRLREYVDIPENRERHGLAPDDVGRLHTVARNPDKSKHLETSTLKLCGLDIDFVNLRRETYTEESRNPIVEFGTAEEDAERRDATLNALFYNLHTGLVEDFVGGVEDLRRKILRTPMDPLQTFLDDPLRVLRLIRFASRFEFSIDPAAEALMADDRVLDKLRVKISRERVYQELEKMLKREQFEHSSMISTYFLERMRTADMNETKPNRPERHRRPSLHRPTGTLPRRLHGP